VILLAEDAVDLIQVFDLIDVDEAAAGKIPRLAVQAKLVEASPVQEAVAGGEMDREGRRVLEALLVTGHECRESASSVFRRRCRSLRSVGPWITG
jgi:hypothetical protein